MKIKFKSLISVFLLAISFNACTSEQKKLSTQIDQLEKSMYADSSMVPDAVKAKEIIGLYTAFADKFPADTMSASFLFKAADISSKINETEQAISLFGKLYKLYPQNKNAPFALFLQGFIYENQVGDAVKARPYYNEFLKKFPDHPIAGDVAFSLENLGKSPEELIMQFENQIQSDSLNTNDSTASVAK